MSTLWLKNKITIITTITIVLGVMNMGHKVCRVGIESTSLAFHTSVLTITPTMFPDIVIVLIPTYICGSLSERSVQTTMLIPLEL